LHCEVGAGVFEEERPLPMRNIPIGNDRQLLDVERDRLDTVPASAALSASTTATGSPR